MAITKSSFKLLSKATKEIAEEGIEKVGKELVEEGVSKVTKEIAEEGVSKAGKELAENVKVKGSPSPRRLAKQEASRQARLQYNQDIATGFDHKEAVKNARLNKQDLIEKRWIQQNTNPKEVSVDYAFARSIDPEVKEIDIARDIKQRNDRVIEKRRKKFEDGIARKPISDDAMREASAASAQFESGTAAGETSTTSTSRSKPKRNKSAQDVANNKSINQWIRKNKTGEFDDFANYINKGDTPDSVLENMYSKNKYIQQAMGGGDNATWENFKGLKPNEQLNMINVGKELRVNDVGLMDKIGYNKVPQMAAGIGTTAWLVSRLDRSKGQMSNAQLYGQQQY